MRACTPIVLAALLLAGGSAQAQDAADAPASPAPQPQAEAVDAAGEPDAAPETPAAAAQDTAPAGDTAAAEPTVEGSSSTAAPEPQDEAEPALPDPNEAPEVPMEEPAALTADELASLGIDNIEEASRDTQLHFNGFMDVTYAHLLNPNEAPLVITSQGSEGSFFVGRFNLFLTKNLTDTFSMMAEVRFTYAPNGTRGIDLSAAPGNTETVDYSQSALSFRWGGIVIERAYGEWSPLPYLNVRAGAYLTPYGIWNVDHGTPVFITVARPFAVGGNFFPERQTGLEVYGRVALSPKVNAGYHLTLSNGLGSVAEYRDLDSNKALGSRLVLEHVGNGSHFQVGGSTFWGESSTSIPSVGLTADGSALRVVQSTAGNSEVLSLAADMRWKFRGFLLQAEWVGQRLEWDENGRTPLPTAGQLGVPPGAVAPDTFGWGGYILTGYRLPWWGIMPFATVEYARSYNIGIRSRTAFSQVGINVRPVGSIVFKLQYQFAFAGSPGTQGDAVAAQLAWAF